jgi:serine protease Do
MNSNKIISTIALILCVFSINAQDLSSIYSKVNAAVVVIYTQENSIVTNGNNESTQVTTNNLGSGFLISRDLIVTAAHVVKVPESLKVLFVDNEVINAKVISTYQSADIALIKLEHPKINPTTVTFGDSDSVKVGQQVFVVGAPFGIDHSLSSGYVSGFKRQSMGKNPFTTVDFIQTDAAINQGNSGGPMFNLDGEVIGIVSHIATKTGGFQGIGYACSSNLASYLLLNNKMPWLGGELHPLSPEETAILNVPQKSGLLVQRVASGSIFDKMGVKGGTTEAIIKNRKLILGGDIILTFNNITFEVTDQSLIDIANVAKDITKDSNFQITVLRNGKVITLKY